MPDTHKGEDMKGRGKEALGSLTDDEDLKREGKLDQASASIKDKADKATESVKDAINRD